MGFVTFICTGCTPGREPQCPCVVRPSILPCACSAALPKAVIHMRLCITETKTSHTIERRRGGKKEKKKGGGGGEESCTKSVASTSCNLENLCMLESLT